MSTLIDIARYVPSLARSALARWSHLEPWELTADSAGIVPQLTPITLSFEKAGGDRRDLNVAAWGYAVSEGWLREDEDGNLFLTAKGYEQG